MYLYSIHIVFILFLYLLRMVTIHITLYYILLNKRVATCFDQSYGHFRPFEQHIISNRSLQTLFKGQIKVSGLLLHTGYFVLWSHIYIYNASRLRLFISAVGFLI